MKLRSAAAAAALFALAIPGVASADDSGLTYESVTHCAAFNMLLAQAMSVGDDAAKHKADADTFSNQAAALMVVATMIGKVDVEKVKTDVSSQNDAMLKAMMSDKAASDKLIEDNLETCNAMGKAANDAVNEATKGKT